MRRIMANRSLMPAHRPDLRQTLLRHEAIAPQWRSHQLVLPSQSMIPKSGYRFSEKIMLHKKSGKGGQTMSRCRTI
jgi:hypothetical protein